MCTFLVCIPGVYDEDILLMFQAAAQWMREHKDELLSQNLLDNDEEIMETEREGEWPGHAAIVALSNLLKVNIAVVQGGFVCSCWWAEREIERHICAIF